jgi:hypothetical protein
MRTRTISTCVLLALLGPIAAAWGQSLPSKTEAAERLKSVMLQVSLHDRALPPFHLKATIHYEFDNQLTEARYELYWAGPDKFRREYRTGAAVDIDLVADGKRYVVRPMAEQFFPLVRLNDLIFSPLGFLGENPKVSKVRFEKAGSAKRMCIESDQEFYHNQVCLESGSGQIVSASSIYGFRKKTPQVLLEDFAPLGERRYPRRITRRYAPGTLEVEIKTLETVEVFADDVFAPSPSAVSVVWCSDPTRTGDPPTFTRLNFDRQIPVQCDFLGCMGQEVLVNPVDLYPEPADAYYVLVGDDGRAKKFLALFPRAEAPPSFFQNAQFPVYSCSGKPIAYDGVYIPTANAPRPGEILLR